MTLDLEAIEQRASYATSGPWYLDEGGDDGVYTQPRPSDTSVEVAAAFFRPDEVFIAHAREDVPALIARIRELEAGELKRSVESLEQLALVFDDEEMKLAARMTRAHQLEPLVPESVQPAELPPRAADSAPTFSAQGVPSL